MKILIVKHSSTMRQMIMRELRALNQRELAEAHDGPTAITRLAEGGIDLVIVDFRLQGMPGVELIRQIRANDATRTTPIILTVPYAERDQAAVQLSGLQIVLLIKPFNSPSLNQALEQVRAQAASR